MIDPIRSPQAPVLHPSGQRGLAPEQQPANPTDGFSPNQSDPVTKLQQQPPVQNPYPRPMTEDEKADFKSWFPNLDVEAARVTHEATPQYNCISWTTGNTQSWDWPPSMYGGTPQEAFQQYYTERGFSPISAEEAANIGKDKEVVAYWEDPNGPTHGSVSGSTHGERWESKCGQAAQIQHGRDELESEVYGKIAGYWLKTSEGKRIVREIPLEARQRLDAKLALRVVSVEPEVAQAFSSAYSQWQSERSSSKVAVSSNPADYLKGEGYQKLLALGKAALPLWIDKMRSGDFFCQYGVQELTKAGEDAFQIKGPNPQPELKPQEVRCSEQDKANQVMVQWLDSQW
ncbi:hypothetical protein JST97_05185 [bacterium]|nr:hypothetical protein [bacterium]